MADGTREDYEFLSGLYEGHARACLTDSLFDLLARMEGPTLGYRVDRAEHSRQSATRALRITSS